MRRLVLPLNHVLIQQGSDGTDLYILEKGQLDVFVNGDKVNTIFPGWAFGELGFLFNCFRYLKKFSFRVNIISHCTLVLKHKFFFGR
eukprot:UN26641